MLKRHMFIGLVALAFGKGAFAGPITFSITFTTNSGISPTSGVFTYDSTTAMFSNFIVVWDGFTFDMTSAANAGPNGGVCGVTSGPPGIIHNT